MIYKFIVLIALMADGTVDMKYVPQPFLDVVCEQMLSSDEFKKSLKDYISLDTVESAQHKCMTSEEMQKSYEGLKG